MQANVDDARGLSFECQPGCGFCCTASPLVLPMEAPRLGSMVRKLEDGTLRIPVSGPACSALQPDARCGVYERRPAVCRVYPYQVHAGRRVQVAITLACPGITERVLGPHAPLPHAVHPTEDTDDMTAGARRIAEEALAAPGGAEMARLAKETFVEFDRRMKEWGVLATPDKLRGAYQPNLAALAQPGALPSFFAGLGDGDLLLEGKAPKAVEALFEAEPEADLLELLEEAARDAFSDNGEVLWVEPGFAWTQPRLADDQVELVRHHAADRKSITFDVGELPLDWTPEASAVLAAYLERLTRRDHTEGAACWLVDASGYQATLPAAYGRVLGEAALQVVLRAGLAAAEEGATEISPAFARRGVSAYETSFHSLPTLGSIL